MSRNPTSEVTITLTAAEWRILASAAVSGKSNVVGRGSAKTVANIVDAATKIAEETGKREPSGDFTDDTAFKNFPAEGEERSHKDCYIEHTKGLWVRKNRAADELEVWYDGKFQASWRGADVLNDRLKTLLRFAFDLGKREGKRELGDVVTTKVLADAFDCFSNEAISSMHSGTHDIGCISSGIRAIAARLREA